LQASVNATKKALTWNVEEWVPPAEKHIFKFHSKEDLKKWHLYSDSEYGGLSSASLEIPDKGDGSDCTGVFSGNLSVDLSEGSKWNISRSGFCGMRSKKVNNTELSFILLTILIQNIFSACQSLFEEKKENGLLYLSPGFVNERLFESAYYCN
jgi:hypothetical protein